MTGIDIGAVVRESLRDTAATVERLAGELPDQIAAAAADLVEAHIAVLHALCSAVDEARGA